MSPQWYRVKPRSSAKKSSKSQLASLRSTLPRRTEPSLPRSSGATFFRGKLISGSASLIVTLKDIGFLNQLAKVSSSPTGILANQTTMGDLERRTVFTSTPATISGMILIATTNQETDGWEQLFVRSEKDIFEILLMYSILNNLSKTVYGCFAEGGEPLRWDLRRKSKVGQLRHTFLRSCKVYFASLTEPTCLVHWCAQLFFSFIIPLNWTFVHIISCSTCFLY